MMIFKDLRTSETECRSGVDSVGTYTVGTAPEGVAFDGTNIWVANKGSNSVSKIPAF